MFKKEYNFIYTKGKVYKIYFYSVILTLKFIFGWIWIFNKCYKITVMKPLSHSRPIELYNALMLI